ncbi:MAG: DUF2059 domain-containing protein [Pseudomonadota bacterium]
MKRFFLAAAAAATLSLSPLCAQADDADDLAREIGVGGQLIQNIQPLLPMMSNQVVTQFKQMGLPLMDRVERDGKGGLPRFKEIFEEEFVAALQTQVPELDSNVAQMFRDMLTAQELKDTKAFVNTPAGKKFLGALTGAQGELQKFGEKAGMRAGSVAGPNAIERAEKEMF